ncbi:MAG TPA: AraC family transcriptional regulator [Ohtaekwangia sp.]|uniref:AraC family transcriptional regulator n=1 Tax=Ohtaekwangia sp. TaxID=2066019 RepID=UPI002F930975
MKNIPIRYLSGAQAELNHSENFNIRDLQKVTGGKDMVQELHRHDFNYILVVKKGGGKHTIDFTAYPVADHSVFFMRPGQVHQLMLTGKSTGYLLGFKTDFYAAHNPVANQLLRKAGSINFYKLDAGRFKKLIPITSYILQEYTDKQQGYQEVIKANLNILFVELTRQREKASSNNANLYTQERLEKFLELLDANISKHKQVAYYADALNLSSYQLNAITRAALGKTCSDLITEYILLEAKRYLLATPNQVSQVAYQLGYEDVSYFIRFFKKHTGYSPEAFRQNFK